MVSTVINIAVLAVFIGIGLRVFYPDIFHKELPLATRLNSSYDYIIVGGGTAGCVLAGRLSENADVSVLLLEAGGSDLGEPMIDIPGMTALTWGSHLDWVYRAQPQEGINQAMKEQRTYIPRGRVLGGSSSINAMSVVRGSRHDYDRWSRYTGDKTWDYSHVLSYFKKLEDMRIPGLRESPYHGKDGPIEVNRMNQAPISQKLMEAGQEAGLPANPDYNGKTMEGIGNVQNNRKDGRRYTPSHAYLHPAIDRPNLDVVVNAHVQKVIIKNGQAEGVEVIRENLKHVVSARREVILSAGAIGSPHILLLSGVGPRKQLEALNISVAAELPVGENLQDHVCVDVVAGIDQPLSWTVRGLGSVWSILRYYLFGTGPLNSAVWLENTAFHSLSPETKRIDWPDLEIQMFSGVFGTVFLDALNVNEEHRSELKARDAAEYGFTCTPTVQRPESRGTIALASADPFDHPLIRARYLDSQHDIDVILKGIEVCRDIVNSKTMQAIGARFLDTKPISGCQQFEFESREYWTCMMKRRPYTIYHHSGTCKMGPDGDPTAVVDSKLRVRGVKKLRVVDTSIMPWVTSGNTHIPTIMIAEKAADMILGKPALPPTNVA